MEKILSFFKNNMAIVILVILVVLMMCKPRKNKRVTEKFSSPNDIDETEFQRLIDEAKNSCNKTCTGPIAEGIDGTRKYSYCPTNNGVTKTDYQNGYEKEIYNENTIECDNIYKQLHEIKKKLQETDEDMQKTDEDDLKNLNIIKSNIKFILKNLMKKNQNLIGEALDNDSFFTNIDDLLRSYDDQNYFYSHIK